MLYWKLYSSPSLMIRSKGPVKKIKYYTKDCLDHWCECKRSIENVIRTLSIAPPGV